MNALNDATNCLLGFRPDNGPLNKVYTSMELAYIVPNDQYHCCKVTAGPRLRSYVGNSGFVNCSLMVLLKEMSR